MFCSYVEHKSTDCSLQIGDVKIRIVFSFEGSMNQAFKAMMGTTNRLEQLPKVSSAFKRLAFVNFRTTLLRQEVGRLGSHRFEINTCAL